MSHWAGCHAAARRVRKASLANTQTQVQGQVHQVDRCCAVGLRIPGDASVHPVGQHVKGFGNDKLMKDDSDAKFGDTYALRDRDTSAHASNGVCVCRL